MKISRTAKIVVAAAAAIALFGTQASFGAATINGDGSTFAQPLLSVCKTAWQSATGNTFGAYPGNGSGTGISNAKNGLNDYNFADYPSGVGVASYPAYANTNIVQVPAVAAPIAIAYNLGGRSQKQTLYLSQKTLSGIFSGAITMWNDPSITADNNGSATIVTYKLDAKGNPVKDASGKPVVLKTSVVTRHFTLPAQTIKLVVRSDGSGTTYNLVYMLAKLFPTQWANISDNSNAKLSNTFSKDYPGAASDLLGRIQQVKGSALVAAQIAKTPYSIGYAEANFATNNYLSAAAIQNASGAYQTPTAAGVAQFLDAATFAADGAGTFNYADKSPGDYILGIISYALVDSSVKGAAAAAVKSFLTYVVSDACPTTDSTLQFTTLPAKQKAVAAALIAKLPSA
jgi:phosphate transport system substrate-binding protein